MGQAQRRHNCPELCKTLGEFPDLLPAQLHRWAGLSPRRPALPPGASLRSRPRHRWHFELDTLCCGGCPVHCRLFSTIPGLYEVPVAHTLTPPCCDNQNCPLRGTLTLPPPLPHATPTPTPMLGWSYPGGHSVLLIARQFCSQEDKPRRGQWGPWKDSGAGATVALNLGPSDD